jgi:hypothetical protein
MGTIPCARRCFAPVRWLLWRGPLYPVEAPREHGHRELPVCPAVLGHHRNYAPNLRGAVIRADCDPLSA